MNGEWIERKSLIIVKAYPNPSAKHFETVCVAGITEEEGLVRFYPVNFRSLPEDKKFKKYQLIRLKCQRHSKDRRPESFQPDENSIQLLNELDTKNGWLERWRWIRPTIQSSMCELMHLQESEKRSLGCIKPIDVRDFKIEDADEEFTGRKKAIIDQMVLFDPVESKLEKIPYKFIYHYRCEDKKCPGHKQSIIDWELAELYRKLARQQLTKNEIQQKIREKFLDEICSPKKDTYFFVGNHSQYPNTFMIIGAFWPPKSAQKDLFH